MPLYEYECENGHRFEKILKFSDPPLEVCPTCGAAVRKLISSPAIQFKGSGFYITDYPKKDSSAAGKGADGEKSEKSEKSDGKEAKSSAPASETKSETKTESRSESKTESKSESKPSAPKS